jgi:hypothetical protein
LDEKGELDPFVGKKILELLGFINNYIKKPKAHNYWT